MPQMTKGGKFIFGWSRVKPDGTIIFPKWQWTNIKSLRREKFFCLPAASPPVAFVSPEKGC